jgi:hypothetical protein
MTAIRGHSVLPGKGQVQQGRTRRAGGCYRRPERADRFATDDATQRERMMPTRPRGSEALLDRALSVQDSDQTCPQIVAWPAIARFGPAR